MTAPDYRKVPVCGLPSITSEVAAWCKRRDIERRRRAAYHGGDGRTCRRTRGEADVLVTECKPQTLMPGRRSDHRQAVRQRRPRPAPGFADGLAELDDTARHRLHRVNLCKRRRRVTVGQFDARGNADAVL